MSKEKEIFKITNYDKFKCTADKCRFTCCLGWDVSIDAETYNRWKKENEKCTHILNNVKMKKSRGKIEYSIKKENHEACPLLDKQGLCKVVKELGEDYLSATCHKFPRIENVFENKKELSLSCACPEVVELISSGTGKINIISENNDINLKSNLIELRIREALINIMQQEDLILEEKLIINFQMLLTILEERNSSENNILKKLERFNDRKYVQELIDGYKETMPIINDCVEEINYLFLDIIKNYKEVSNFEIIFKDIANFAETIKIESLCAKWQNYKSLYEEYDEFIQNCIVSDIFSSCVSNNFEEMTISFQMIILEFLLVRYSVYLKYCMDKKKEIEVGDIKDYIVAFSRIIGNNTEAVKEFLKDGFGKAVLDIGYLCFITLF